MLKKRLSACLTIKDGWVVQSIGFSKYLPVGKPEIAVEFLNNWGIDEIIYLDIDATKNSLPPNFELIKKVSEKCFVPLAVGGGITNIEEIHKLFHSGADKIVLNNEIFNNPSLISQTANIFGNQSVIASLDVIKDASKKYKVYSYINNKPLEINPVEYAKQVEQLGAGEILLNSVDKDGSKSGYDIEITKKIVNAVHIPVIACGGAGHPKHFLEVFNRSNPAAAAAGNFFHFTEHSVTVVKSYLKRKGINIRLETIANYLDFSFDESGRVAKKSDKYLDKQRFEIYHPEII